MNQSSRWRPQKQRCRRGGKVGNNDKSAADGHTHQLTLSNNGNGGSICDGDVDDNVDGYVDDDGSGVKRK
jgi:hypothetical protein